MMSRTSPWERDQPDELFRKPQAKPSRAGTPSPKGPKEWGSLHLQGMSLEGQAATNLLIGEVDPMVPGIRLAPGHRDHSDALEAIPVNPWGEEQRPVPAGVVNISTLGTTA